jgi:hypothetical protein
VVQLRRNGNVGIMRWGYILAGREMGQTFEVARNHVSMNIATLTHFPEAPGDFFGRSSSGLQKLLETNTILP